MILTGININFPEGNVVYSFTPYTVSNGEITKDGPETPKIVKKPFRNSGFTITALAIVAGVGTPEPEMEPLTEYELQTAGEDCFVISLKLRNEYISSSRFIFKKSDGEIYVSDVLSNLHVGDTLTLTKLYGEE